MLEELESNGLEVIKVKTEHGYIRAVVSRNCDWYREFCGNFISYRHGRARRPRTKIKRCHTVRGLNELLKGGCKTLYAA